MNKSSAWLVALNMGLLLICGNAAAQGQPIGNGIYACDGAAQAGPCQPEGDNDSSYSSGDGYTDNDYAHAEPKWADRWGAIATDGGGKIGIVTDLYSKADAQQSAIAECKKDGGGRCEVRLAYFNQCVAVASSSTDSNSSSAATEEQAKSNALKTCEKRDGAGSCHIYYSGCSLPERIQ